MIPVRRFPIVLIAFAMIAGSASAQGDGDSGNEPLKNVTIFKGKTRKEIVTIMKTFTQGLGVKCSHCHVKDYASDEKPEKKSAREMIKMLDEMNEKYPMLEKKGTCFMCHRGNKEVAFTP
jgi:hypothetical protein